MFVLMTYDVNVRRIVRALNTARRYLRRVQNSVFEGELTPGKFSSLKGEMSRVLDFKTDKVLFYTWRTTKSASIELMEPGIGDGANTTVNFI